MYIYFFYNNFTDQINQQRLCLIQQNKKVYMLETTKDVLDQKISEEFMKYKVIDGELPIAYDEEMYVVCNHIPVAEEGRDQFEARFLNRARKIEEEAGFIAIRVCRPLNSDTYVIITFWQSEQDFTNWQESKAYKQAHEKRRTEDGIDQKRPDIFPRPSYLNTYHVQKG
ncbi:antibiotic biosynthesis monooxygenase [Paraliobacillus sp. JSM ZJ581]|uniref:antibiotic biosynthesis monooxygenase family protein n=1 Tax=Paraliobacillus sp. JSM ZJ581 TaxID=3342118 RepID=UPI0035A9ABEA